MSVKRLRVLLKELESMRPPGRYPPTGYRRVRRGYYHYGHPIWILVKVPAIWQAIKFMRFCREREEPCSWGQIAELLRAEFGKSPSGKEWTKDSAKALHRRWRNKPLPEDPPLPEIQISA